jgi:hypothetical protein
MTKIVQGLMRRDTNWQRALVLGEGALKERLTGSCQAVREGKI